MAEKPGLPSVIDVNGIGALIAALARRGYEVIGPKHESGAILYAPIRDLADLPRGVSDEQEAGRYRLREGTGDAFFDFTVGPESWKRYLHPPDRRLFRATRTERGFSVDAEAPPPRPLAFFGVRACDIQAIRVLDRVLAGGDHPDEDYVARRRDLLVIAVNCGRAGGTCFCTSMGTGPKAREGFDLALTELRDESRHDFLVEHGTDRGASLLEGIATRLATEEDQRAARDATARAEAGMGRVLDAANIKGLLQANREHPHWDEVAERCLACTNCTLVCPTCFCTTVTDHTDLTGNHAERRQRWDSCFTLDFSYLHGGSIRKSHAARYRQWMTHKLADWYDQFGSSGCVGCGRCITWCPVGIDITEEARAIALTDLRYEGIEA